MMTLRYLCLAALLSTVAACTTSTPAERPTMSADGGMTCRPGLALCVEGCVDLRSSETSCGACGNTCAVDQTCRDGNCVNLVSNRPPPTCNTQSDPNNCGSCGNVCPVRPNASPVCNIGACLFTCNNGWGDCDGVVINGCETNLNAASNHCGACGRSCSQGQACSAGACVAIVSNECPTGQNRCSGACCDMQTDRFNCGACGNACASNQSCTAGRCVNNAPVCGSGTILCSGMCVDPSNNVSHCGACNNVCPSGQSCISCLHTVSCAAGLNLCGGICRDYTRDNLACGRCGNVCGVGTRCVSGTCQTDGPTCGSGQSLCGGSCVDTQTDRLNCGACGRACASGQTCSRGACQTPCETLNWCSGRCIDRMSDPNNCGACGVTCSSGQSCMGGHCGGVPRDFHRERVQMTRSLPLPAGQRYCSGSWLPVTWNSLEDHTVEELRTSSPGWQLDTWRMTEGTAILKFVCSTDNTNWLNLRGLMAAGYTTAASLGLVIRIDERPDVADLSPVRNDPFRNDRLDDSYGILVTVPSLR